MLKIFQVVATDGNLSLFHRIEADFMRPNPEAQGLEFIEVFGVREEVKGFVPFSRLVFAGEILEDEDDSDGDSGDTTEDGDPPPEGIENFFNFGKNRMPEAGYITETGERVPA